MSDPATWEAVDRYVGELGDDAGVQGMRRFHELVAAEPRLDATTIQTVGLKGHDGFTLALVGYPAKSPGRRYQST